ncbi:MAG TPA: TetR/AcrR family transcriptional regulator C-terminal domain-containing protein [Anaerolineales bacterium]|nr:TetR/AcrR family transcriptional regulator C-terminal domain-containing protein [Anaerolineales bacterium]
MPRPRKPLTRDVILTAALRIVDEEGLEALSMRRVATAVGVEAMSLYNHVNDKQDLLNGLADLVLAGITPPDPSRRWDRRLEAIAIGLYEALITHPALVVVLASEQGRPTDLKVLQGMDGILAALAESGLSPRRQVSAYRGLLALCLGFVLTHTLGLTATKSEALTTWAAWDPGQWDPKTLPNLARLAPQFQKTHADDDFRFMLEAYLETLRRATTGRARRR